MLSKNKKSPGLRHIIQIQNRNGFFLLRVTYGHHKYRAVSLIKSTWHPDQVARALRKFAQRLDDMPLDKGIKAVKGKA